MTHANHVTHLSSTSTNNFDNARVGFSDEQWEILRSFLASKPTINMTGDCSTATWIIDSGASNHVTGNINFFTNIGDHICCPVREQTCKLPKSIRTIRVIYSPVKLHAGNKF